MLKQVSIAIALESAAVSMLFIRTQDLRIVLSFLALHGAASVLIAIISWPIFRRYFQDGPRWPIALFFSLAFFVPVLGLVGFLIGLTIALWMPKATMYKPYATVPIPQFSPARSGVEPSFRSTSVRADIVDREVPEELRLKALLSVQEMPARATSGLLRDLLADHSDDIRLLCYGMLRNKERAISERVAHSMEQFKEAKSDIAKFQAAKELAELNWELVYQKLVVGDMRRHALKQGLHYVDEAARLRDDDPGLWNLASRLAFHADQVDTATQYIEKALENGYPRARAIPDMAEHAFALRDFERLRALVLEFPDEHRVPLLAPVSRYWKSVDE